MIALIATRIGIEMAAENHKQALQEAAPALLTNLEALVQWYGKRDGVDGSEELLPFSHQEREIQDAMRAIAQAKGEVLP